MIVLQEAIVIGPILLIAGILAFTTIVILFTIHFNKLLNKLFKMKGKSSESKSTKIIVASLLLACISTGIAFYLLQKLFFSLFSFS